MQLTAITALAAILGLLAWQTVRDRRDYALFKTVQDTHSRRAFMWRWSVLCTAMFAGGGVLILLALGRIDALWGLPAEFAPLVPTRSAEELAQTNSDYALGLAIGASISVIATAVIWRLRIAKMRQPIVGDVEPLLPREAGEYRYAATLAFAAGITEEIFFRLALPLLAYHATGNAIAAFAIAGITFGLMHWYQGWKGVAATTAVGALLAWLYLSSGSLLKPILVHIAIDLVALVIRPALAAHFNSRSAPAS